MIDVNKSKELGKLAVDKKYKEAVELIQEKDDVVRLLAIAFDNEGYGITTETQMLSELILLFAKSNFDSTFCADVAVFISEHKTNIETYFLDNAELASDYSINNGDNPCMYLYEKLVTDLYVLSIEKSNTKDEYDVIIEYLEYEGYTLEEFKKKNNIGKKMINEYVGKFSNYLQTIKSNRYKKLDFNRKKLSCMDVNLTVIECFKRCIILEDMEDFKDLPDEIKNLSKEKKSNNYPNECIDLLGVYIAPFSNDKANILLSREKIYDVAKRYNLEFESIYNFVKIHEYAHASMCPKLADENCNININTASYVLLEESLATAIALKKMRSTAEYSKLEQFVNAQALQYRYGLELLNQYENKIEYMMIVWKALKCSKIAHNLDKNAEIATLFYIITRDNLLLDYLLEDIKEFFLL